MRRPIQSWIETLLLERRPWWICWLSPWYRDRYLRRCILPQLLAAQDAGTGIFEAWVEPGTSQTEVAYWLEQCIATAKSTHDDYGMIRVVVAHCTEAEWEAGGADMTQRLVLNWDGMAHQWWSIGYPLALRATGVEHSGLYIALNITGMWISRGMGMTKPHTDETPAEDETSSTAFVDERRAEYSAFSSAPNLKVTSVASTPYLHDSAAPGTFSGFAVRGPNPRSSAPL